MYSPSPEKQQVFHTDLKTNNIKIHFSWRKRDAYNLTVFTCWRDLEAFGRVPVLHSSHKLWFLPLRTLWWRDRLSWWEECCGGKHTMMQHINSSNTESHLLSTSSTLHRADCCGTRRPRRYFTRRHKLQSFRFKNLKLKIWRVITVLNSWIIKSKTKKNELKILHVLCHWRKICNHHDDRTKQQCWGRTKKKNKK